MKAVKIHWQDSFSIDPWITQQSAIEQTKEAMECISVGFELTENDDVVVICHSVNADGMVCGILQIPKKCIEKRDYFHEVKEN